MTARQKAKAAAATVGSFLLLVGGVNLAITLLERQCIVREIAFDATDGAQFVADHGTPALAAKCVDGCQMDVVITVKDTEAALEPGAMITQAAAAAGVTEDAWRSLLKGLTFVGDPRRAGTGAQCPETRIKVIDVQSGCLGGHVSRPGRADYFGVCCDPDCTCQPGKTCPTVPRSRLRGSDAHRKATCRDGGGDLAHCPPSEP